MTDSTLDDILKLDLQMSDFDFSKDIEYVLSENTSLIYSDGKYYLWKYDDYIEEEVVREITETDKFDEFDSSDMEEFRKIVEKLKSEGKA